MKLLISANGFQKTALAPAIELAHTYFDNVVTNPWGRRGTSRQIMELWEDADAIICGAETFDRAMIERAPASLKVLSRYGVGLDNIDLQAAKRAGIIVTNTPGANANSVADMTLALILATIRQLPRHDSEMRKGLWQRHTCFELFGKNLGIIGYGNIGHKVAERALGFGLNILVHDPFVTQDKPNSDITFVSFPDLVGQSDIITLHIPLSNETEHIINEKTLALMKEGSILINTSRGELIAESALVQALQEGKVFSAGLDVFTHEPLDHTSPLLQLPNIVLSPHQAANTVEASLRMGLQSIENAWKALNSSGF